MTVPEVLLCWSSDVSSYSGSFREWQYFGQRPFFVAYALKVARYSFSRSIPPKFERKLRRHKQRFGKIDTTVVLDKDEHFCYDQGCNDIEGVIATK